MPVSSTAGQASSVTYIQSVKNDTTSKDAIYGTKSWKATRQWRGGAAPKIEYNKEFSTAYDVMKATVTVEAFFTSKGRDVYAIMTHWPGRQIEIKDVDGIKAVSLLGSNTPLKFKPTKTGVSVELLDLPEDLLAQPAWTLKLTR